MVLVVNFLSVFKIQDFYCENDEICASLKKNHVYARVMAITQSDSRVVVTLVE
jgi:hypothetical protein